MEASISIVSVEPQTPTRRSLALTMMASAFAGSAFSWM